MAPACPFEGLCRGLYAVTPHVNGMRNAKEEASSNDEVFRFHLTGALTTPYKAAGFTRVSHTQQQSPNTWEVPTKTTRNHKVLTQTRSNKFDTNNWHHGKWKWESRGMLGLLMMITPDTKHNALRSTKYQGGLHTEKSPVVHMHKRNNKTPPAQWLQTVRYDTANIQLSAHLKVGRHGRRQESLKQNETHCKLSLPRQT